MREIRATFLERKVRTSTATSFRFQPDEKIDFLPGQFLHLIFDQKDRGNSSLNKYLSFSSAPGKDYFEVTKRISESAFSKGLLNLKHGDKLLIKASMGNCVFKPEFKKICFLAGGIGITPVISIIEHVAANSLENDIHLQ